MIPPVLEQSTVTPRVNGNCLSTGGPIRLNLGGFGDGKSGKIEGFLVVDIQDIPQVDVVTDCSNLSMFKDNSVTEIYASNILEHWPHVDTLRVLKEWFRVLIPGGILWISVPDMDANVKMFQKYGLTQWVQNIIWGDQYHPFAFHYINFTFGSLAKVVMDAGFSDIKRVLDMPFGLPDASAHRDNLDFNRISLNVKCLK